MASLSPGVLLRLLQDPDPCGISVRRPPLHAPPAVLQITGIVPAGPGPDLSPDHGFYVKVSDSSHSTYVSLPPDLNDLILADRLQIGQFIHVRRIEPASPVPILRDFRLLTGRHPCHHDTVDLSSASPSPESTPRARRSAASSAGTPPLPPPEKKKRQLHSRSNSTSGDRSSEASMSLPSFTSSSLSGAARKKETKRRGSDVLSELKNMGFTSTDEDTYDSDDSRFSYTSSSPMSSRFSCTSSSSSSFSSSSSSFTMRPRKSWVAAGNVTERRQETKPTSRSQSAAASPKRLHEHVSLMPKEDASSAISACRRNTEKIFKVLANSTKRKLPDPDRTCTEISSATSSYSSPDHTKCPDKIGVIWALLPPNLMRHGKEVLRQRDSALQAAVDALLEASASERLIECLSMYSELQSDKDGDPQLVVNRFLNFHHKLGQTRLIAQSLSRSSQQPSSCNFNSATPTSIRSVAKVASDRKSCATAWIKAAMESDLSRVPPQLKIAPEPPEVLPPSNGNMLNPIIPKQKNVVPKGSSLLLASNALQYEYNRWFLRYIDKFLDSIQTETRYNTCELEVATLLCQLKRVDDWLNNITSKEITWPRERIKDSMLSDDDEAEACERVRRKIYSILLRHVESAANALESIGTTDEEKDRDIMLNS